MQDARMAHVEDYVSQDREDARQIDQIDIQNSHMFPQSQESPMQPQYASEQQNQIRPKETFGGTIMKQDMIKTMGKTGLSQMLQTQSLSQQPLTDRDRTSVVEARQGMQGAGNDAQDQALNVPNNQGPITNSIGDRLSSLQFVLSESGNGNRRDTITSGNNIINVTDFNAPDNDQRLQLQFKWSLTCSNNESLAGFNESGKFNQHLVREQAISNFNSNLDDVRIMNTSQSNLADENYSSMKPSAPQAQVVEEETKSVSHVRESQTLSPGSLESSNKEEYISMSNTILTGNNQVEDPKIVQESPDTAQRRNNTSQEISTTVRRIQRQLQPQNQSIKVIPQKHFKDCRVLSPDKQFEATVPRRESPGLNVLRRSVTRSGDRERAISQSAHSSQSRKPLKESKAQEKHDQQQNKLTEPGSPNESDFSAQREEMRKSELEVWVQESQSSDEEACATISVRVDSNQQRSDHMKSGDQLGEELQQIMCSQNSSNEKQNDAQPQQHCQSSQNIAQPVTLPLPHELFQRYSDLYEPTAGVSQPELPQQIFSNVYNNQQVSVQPAKATLTIPSMPTDSTQQFIENALSGVSQIAYRDRNANPSFKTIKGSINDDSTPVSNLACRNPTFQQTNTNQDGSSNPQGTPIPTFQQNQDGDCTPLSLNGNQNPSFLQVPEDNNPLCRSTNSGHQNAKVQFDKHTVGSWDNFSNLPSLRSNTSNIVSVQQQMQTLQAVKKLPLSNLKQIDELLLKEQQSSPQMQPRQHQMQLVQGNYNLQVCELSHSEEGRMHSARDDANKGREVELNTATIESLARSIGSMQQFRISHQNRTIPEVENESQDDHGSLMKEQLLTKEVTSRQTTSSPSLMFSQTNQDRVTLQSVMYTQEKPYQNQPSTGKKQFAQTTEKKQTMLANHHHLPSFFTSQQIQPADTRQQSVSSFTQNNGLEESKTEDSHRYFVNALGQRISSTVLEMNQDDIQLRELFYRNGLDAKLRQQSSEEAKLHSEEKHPEKQLMTEQEYIIKAGFHQQATKYPSTTKSVPEANFHSEPDLQAEQNLRQRQAVNFEAGPGDKLQDQQRQMARAEKNIEDKNAVKRNLNEAFTTRQRPEVPKGQNEIVTMAQKNKSPTMNRASAKEKQSQSKTHRSKLTNSYQVNENTHIVHDTADVIDLDGQNANDSNYLHQRLLYRNRTSKIKSQELQSCSRVTRAVKDSEQSATGESSQSSNEDDSGDLVSVQQLKQRSYSFRACADLFQRYDTLKHAQHAQKNTHHLLQAMSSGKKNSGQKRLNSDPTGEAVLSFTRTGPASQAQEESDEEEQEEQRETPYDYDEENEHEEVEDSDFIEESQRQDEYCSDDYGTQLNGHTQTDQYIDDFLTEDDIAVFKSQPNDIPYDLDSAPMRKAQTKRKQVEDNLSQFSFEFEEEDPKRALHRSTRRDRQKSGNRGVSLSTFEATEEENNLEDRLSPKFEKLMLLQSNPSHQEHTQSVQVKLQATQDLSPYTDNLLKLQKASDLSPYTDNSRIGASGKSFLAKGVIKQSSMRGNLHVSATPSTQDRNEARARPAIASPGDHFSDDEATSLPHAPHNVVPSCQTTTNLAQKKKRLSIVSNMYRNEAINQQKSAKPYQRQNQVPVSQSNKSRTPNNLTTSQSQKALKIVANNLVLQESVPRDLKAWLSQLSLSQYGHLLVEQGLDDLQSLIQMMSQDRILPLNHQVLEEAGIETSGHRARILVALELAAGVYHHNQELQEYLKALNLSPAQLALQTEQAFGSSLSGPPGINLTYELSREQQQMEETIKMNFPNLMSKSPQQVSAPGLPSNLITASVLPSHMQTIDHFGGYTPMSVQQPTHQTFQSQRNIVLSLSTWLGKNNLLFLHPLFVRSGYDDLKSLLYQAYSQFNQLTDETLQNDIGVAKIGHRLRILSQLRQDALILFLNEHQIFNEQQHLNQMQPSDHNQSVNQSQSIQHNQSLQHDTTIHHSNKKARQFKSVYESQDPQEDQEEMMQNQKLLKSQPNAKKLRPRNYSFNKAGGSAANTSFMLQSNDADFNSKKHSTYFQQSGAPVTPTPYTDKVTLNRKISAKAAPVSYQVGGRGPSPTKQQRRNTGNQQRHKADDQSCAIF